MHTLVASLFSAVGLVDGCRLGSDGFGTAEFQRFNSWNGVVWRNDPDHCDVLGTYGIDPNAMMPVFATKQAVPAGAIVRPALCSLAGGVLMVSDKAVESMKMAFSGGTPRHNTSLSRPIPKE